MRNAPPTSSAFPRVRVRVLVIALLTVAPLGAIAGCESKPYQKDTNSTNYNYQYNK